MAELRKGMWIVYAGNGVGILNAFNADGTAEVHLTEGDGTTRLILPAVAFTELRQARFGEIPEQRRPSPELAASLGYA